MNEHRLKEYRHDLHRMPELGMQLPNTLSYVRRCLVECACTIEDANGNLCAFFDAEKPDTLAFRADMDGMPITERTGAFYASAFPGHMHACGHDGHTAMLLELANCLSERTTPLSHNVLLVFQCAEESTQGAHAILNSGILRRHNVTALIGLHLWPALAQGCIFTRPGPIMAMGAEVNIDIEGRSSHVSKADKGLDALFAACLFLQNVYAGMETLESEQGALMKFGHMQSGTARNVISAHTRLEGTMRCYAPQVFEQMHQLLKDAAAHANAQTGCRTTPSLGSAYPAVYNDDALYQRVCAHLGANAPQSCAPVMAAEDFAFYGQAIPSLFCFLGVGDTPPLHSDTFDFDESCLAKGVEFFESLLDME